MDHLKKNSEYLIVQFDEKNENNIPLVELVPRAWVSTSTTGLQCIYPRSPGNKINKWVKNQKQPDRDWIQYPVLDIVVEARDHVQGLRRLRRFISNSEVAPSTDGDNGDPEDSQSDLTLLQTIPTNELSMYLGKETFLSANDNFRNVIEESINRALRDKSENSESTRNDELKRYFNEKFDELKLDLMRKMDSVKRSLQYDFEKKINEINSNMIFSSTSNVKHSTAARKKLNVPLPIKDLEEFLKFDESLKDDDETKELLIILLKSAVAGATSIQKDIGLMISTVISKSVQTKYSGCGRQLKNVQTKLNFSATATFACMKEILREKYSDGPELAGLSSKLSRWFAGAGDREGGRRERSNQFATEPPSNPDTSAPVRAPAAPNESPIRE